MMWWMMGHGFSPWWMGILWGLIFYGTIIFLFVWGVRNLSGRSQEGQHRDPLAILKERYARGEITREQYEQVKQDLQR